MIPTPFDRSYKVKVNLRPPKFAYFFRDGDTDALTQILEFVCTQWGGIRNLVIAVDRNGTLSEFDRFLLQLVEPHAFVGNFKGWNKKPPGAHTGVLSNLRHMFPERPFDLQTMSSFRQYDPAPHALHVISDEDLHAKRLISRSLENDFGKPWLALALYGGIYPGQESDYSQSISMSPEEVEPLGRSFWESQYAVDPFSSVLNLTGYGVRPRSVAGGSWTNTFNVFLVEDTRDLCYFWNVRAVAESTRFESSLGRRSLMMPSELLTERASIDALARFVQRNVLLPDVHSNVQIGAMAWTSEKSERLSAALEACPTIKRLPKGETFSTQSWFGSKPSKVSLDVSTLTYLPMRPLMPQSYVEGIDRSIPRQVELAAGVNELLLEPPAGFRNRGFAFFGVDVECEVWNRYPRKYAVSDGVDSQAWFSRHGLTNLKAIPQNAVYMKVDLLDEWESLRRCFRGYGYEIQLSKDGQYADALVTLLGAMSNVDLLATKASYLLLDLLALRSTKKIAQRVAKQFGLRQDQLPDLQRVLDDVEVISELKGITKAYRQLSQHKELQPFKAELLGLLDQLTQASVLTRGFLLSCTRCGAPDWFPLEAIRERVRCTGCGNEFHLPVEYPKGSEIQWEYRLNTLVNRGMDQDVLPNLLALHHATKGRSCSCLTTGLTVTNHGKEKEFDFLFCTEQRLHAGECKAGSGLEEKDMATARLAADLGIVKFYFATVGAFGTDAVGLVESLREEFRRDKVTMEVVVLSEHELLNVPYPEGKKAHPVPVRFPPPTISDGVDLLMPAGL